MVARFSFDLALETDRALLEQHQELLHTRAQLAEIPANCRETIAQSRELMTRIDSEIRLRK
jgi:hypothetical protein